MHTTVLLSSLQELHCVVCTPVALGVSMKMNYKMLGNRFSLYISDIYYRDNKPQMLTDISDQLEGSHCFVLVVSQTLLFDIQDVHSSHYIKMVVLMEQHIHICIRYSVKCGKMAFESY
jgi:hypothetical protein